MEAERLPQSQDTTVLGQLGVLWHCDQSPLDTQLGVEHDHPLPVSSGLKTDSPNAVVNIG